MPDHNAEIARPARADYIWGATKPAPDGFINPASVSRAATEEGARHRCEVLGDGHIVVRAESLNWVALPPGTRTSHPDEATP